jgi:hypothetical protein
MIASVVVTLDKVAANLPDTLAEISCVGCVEVGDIRDDGYRVPMMIDSPDPNALEDITRRLQACRGVAFVDVVFVYFEDEPQLSAATESGKPT